ncbi:Ig-like domain-containing protein [Paenibacillus sp. CC-CFT747]|nr:Ig-like domain-containing protein [Paenibacillus sp. CC-CFT747]
MHAQSVQPIRKHLSIVLVFTLLISLFAGIPHSAQAAVGDTTSYSFANLVNVPNDPNWNAVANPSTMRLTTTSFQMINNQVSSAVNGEYLKVNFMVPESGYYDLSFVGWKNTVGGVVDISVDGTVLRSDYSFYSATSTQNSPAAEPLGNQILLKRGMHTLLFQAKQTVKLASNGRYYLYLYLQSFKMQLKQSVPELKQLTLTPDVPSLAKGELQTVALTGTMTDGSPADLSKADSIQFESSDPSIISVDANGTSATLHALALGQSVIKATATLAGVTVSAARRVVVGEPVRFDFTQPIDSTIEQTGWQIVDSKVPAGSTVIRNQEYGIQVQSNEVGQYITFAIQVPASGYYTFNLNGAGASSGAVAALSVDGLELGDYNFYSSAYVKEKGSQMLRTYWMEEGVHRFTLLVKEKAGYFHLYPGLLELVKRRSFPR